MLGSKWLQKREFRERERAGGRGRSEKGREKARMSSEWVERQSEKYTKRKGRKGEVRRGEGEMRRKAKST